MSESVVLYHSVLESDTFDDAAKTLFYLVKGTAKKFPRKGRVLFLDIDGHKNPSGGFDTDMLELQRDFILGFLSQFVHEIHTPLIDIQLSGREQSDDLPEELRIVSSPPNNYEKSAILLPSIGVDKLPITEGVYFLQHKHTRRIKIGKSVNIKSRAGHQIRNNIPFEEDVVCVGYILTSLDYCQTLEKILHDQFKEERVGRVEWFRLSDNLLQFIKQLDCWKERGYHETRTS